jgi:hypothetical protein
VRRAERAAVDDREGVARRQQGVARRRREESMTALRILGVAGAIVIAPILAFGVWLLVTPDYDAADRPSEG